MVRFMDRIDALAGAARERIVILDGAWGVLLQGRGLTEEDFRGERFRDHPRDVKGDPDLLNLTRPDIVTEIHLRSTWRPGPTSPPRTRSRRRRSARPTTA